MSDTSLIVCALAAALIGMAALSMTIDAHWRQLFGAQQLSLVLRTALRLLGAGLLGLSFLLCALADPLLMALLVWPMLLMVAAGAVAAAITLHRRTAR